MLGIAVSIAFLVHGNHQLAGQGVAGDDELVFTRFHHTAAIYVLGHGDRNFHDTGAGSRINGNPFRRRDMPRCVGIDRNLLGNRVLGGKVQNGLIAKNRLGHILAFLFTGYHERGGEGHEGQYLAYIKESFHNYFFQLGFCTKLVFSSRSFSGIG